MVFTPSMLQCMTLDVPRFSILFSELLESFSESVNMLIFHV